MRWQDEGESEENTPLLVFQYTMGFEEKSMQWFITAIIHNYYSYIM